MGDIRRDSLVTEDESVELEVLKVEVNVLPPPGASSQDMEMSSSSLSGSNGSTDTPLRKTSFKTQKQNDKPVEVQSHLAPRKGADLSWHHLSFQVGDKRILKDISGAVPKGKLCAILGPSGAGKTSLLNLLAGRVSPNNKTKVSGEIKLNESVVIPTSISYRQQIAYVMQDDALPATDTPREALTFSATLRLPQNTPRKQITETVNQMLDELGLSKCADVFIGGELIKGISGGERKRTSVGVELITHPSLVFLDEPTSGLDSFAAFNCIETLRKVARAGSGVLCTVHQPSSEIFQLFDWVILLKAGRIVFSGPTTECSEFFSERGFACPAQYNLADHIMFTVQKLTEKEMTERDMWMVHKELEARVRRDSFLGQEKHIVQAKASSCTQLIWLLIRERRAITRNKMALVARFGITIFISTLFGVIFWQAGDQNDTLPENISTHYGALTFAAISAMFGSAQPALLNFPFERPIFLREYSTGTYDVLPYFLSKTVSELPLTFLNSLVQWVLVYFMIGFEGVFFFQVLAAWMLGSAAASVAVMLGCIMSDVKQATEASPLLFVPQLLFAGFFIRISQIPVWLQWVQYTCSLKYALNLLVLSEFNDDLCPNVPTPPDGLTACQRLRASNDIVTDDWWIYLVALLTLFVGFRIIGAIFLVKRARNFY
eukprot:gb/GEZN01001034.1/.p1 GENE.gb/GEZN01001034.1/~~gb/GEZN01001034.1/.p1  ORF type:complete len:661 (+),score=82.30 gb/GEZN01001034.1/:29-2011(+)